ncbi:MAG: hypothetical protein U9R08_02210 [Nanoarchaeota archaeon]|nr:hypothetical protein [Nanoarchaeota archaeon]
MFDEKSNRDLVKLIHERGWDLYDLNIESMNTLLHVDTSQIKPVEVGEQDKTYMFLPVKKENTLRKAIMDAKFRQIFPGLFINQKTLFTMTHLYFGDSAVSGLNVSVTGRASLASIPYDKVLDCYTQKFITVQIGQGLDSLIEEDVPETKEKVLYIRSN